MSTHNCTKQTNTVCGNCGDCKPKKFDIPAEEVETLSGFEALKALPMEQRLVFLLQTLDRLMKSNLSKQKHPALTRSQMDENHERHGAAKAYQDTSKFVTGLFGEELRALLIPKEELH